MPDFLSRGEPLVALAVLLFGLRAARRSRHPRFNSVALLAVGAVLMVVWLRPTLLPFMAPIVALVILVFGLAEAPTFRQPAMFRSGVILVAARLVALAASDGVAESADGGAQRPD